MRPIGFHVSISGGLYRAVPRAVERQCTCLQIFCGNPRAWAQASRSDQAIQRFIADADEGGLNPVVVHACYLINPCAPDDAIFDKSVKRLRAELSLSAAIGADYYVIHPGSRKDKGKKWALQRATRCFAEACAADEGFPPVLLENTAGEHGPGGSFAQMGKLTEKIEQSTPGVKVGLTVDTCHAFAAGYDLRVPSAIDEMAREIDSSMGLERLQLLHLNDALQQVGSQRDRHTHIGEGKIGVEGFHNVLHHDAFRNVPAVLETPWESVEKDVENIRRVRGIITDDSDPPKPSPN